MASHCRWSVKDHSMRTVRSEVCERYDPVSLCERYGYDPVSVVCERYDQMMFANGTIFDQSKVRTVRYRTDITAARR
jgi:hypothetical protein